MELITRGNISKAAFLDQRHKQLSVDDRNEWQDVRIVVIDEVSFMSDTILKTLDRKLKEIKLKSTFWWIHDNICQILPTA